MQPLPCDLITMSICKRQIKYATLPSNVDAAITMRSVETELQNTVGLRATTSEIAAPQPYLDARAKKRILKHFSKGY